MRARVVLPLPGGPHKMKEKSSFFSMATRSGLPPPTRCSCPTNSSSFCGLIFEARGSILISILPGISLSTCIINRAGYSRHMSNKSIVVVVLVIILIGAAGYYAYTNYSPPGEAAAQDQQKAGDVVQAQDTKVGTGAEASPSSIVSVLYVGKLADGTVFDSSEAHGNEPLTFQLGTPGLIAGF